MRRCTLKSKLDRLSPHQKAKLIEWLCDGDLKNYQIQERIWTEFGVKVSSGTLSGFWDRIVVPILLRQRLLKGAFLEVKIRVRQGEDVLGTAEFAVGLNSGRITETSQARTKRPRFLEFDAEARTCFAA